MVESKQITWNTQLGMRDLPQKKSIHKDELEESIEEIKLKL